MRTLAANGGTGDPAALNAESLAAGHRAIELDPDSSYAIGALGSALVFIGQARDAIPYLERAAAIDPTYGPIAATLTMAWVYVGQADEAATCGERAVELARNDPIAGHYSWFALANAELLRGRHDAAETAARRALALNPAYVWSRVVLADVLALQGNMPAAQSTLADAAQAFGGPAKLLDIYRSLHLPRFERASDAVTMTAGLVAAGFGT